MEHLVTKYGHRTFLYNVQLAISIKGNYVYELPLTTRYYTVDKMAYQTIKEVDLDSKFGKGKCKNKFWIKVEVSKFGKLI